MNIDKLELYQKEEKKHSTKLIDDIKKSIDENEASLLVVASHHGKSAIKLAESIKGVKVVSVSEFSYNDKVKKRMKKLKMIPLEKSDLLIQDDKELREQILKYGSGVKAALEVAAIASQKDLTKGKFVSVGGSKKLDTALLVESATTWEDMTVMEVISLPHNEIRV
jgi:hypothetical protein